MQLSYLKNLCLLATLGLLWNCAGSPKQNKQVEEVKKESFFTIDFPSSLINIKEVKLSGISSEVKYIPLETCDKSLLGGIMGVKFSKDYIFINHNGNGLLAQFDWNGKFIRNVGRLGRGPKEYDLMRSFSINEKEELIYIFTNWTRKILIFNFDGEYVKTIKVKGPDVSGDIEWNRDSLFVHYCKQMHERDKYALIEKTGNGDTIQGIPHYYEWKTLNPYPMMVSYWYRNIFYRFNKTLHCRESYNDTIYFFNDQDKLVPKYSVDLKDYALPVEYRPERNAEKFKSADEKWVWFGVQESENYIFLNYSSYIKPKEGIRLEGIICYDKKSHDAYNLKNSFGSYTFENDIDGGPSFIPRFVKDSLGFRFITALDFKEYMESDRFTNSQQGVPELRKKLEELNANLTFDDNHILMVVKLK